MPISRFAALALVALPAALQTQSAPAKDPSPPPAVESAQAQARTVQEMRNVGTAMFSWLVDRVNDENDPGSFDPKESRACVTTKEDEVGSCDMVIIDRLPVISHQELTRILVPQYIDAIPERDGWGNPYEFRLEHKNTLNKDIMAIRSAGGDGKFSGAQYKPGHFPPAEAGNDLVWLDGFFIRWPERQETGNPK